MPDHLTLALDPAAIPCDGDDCQGCDDCPEFDFAAWLGRRPERVAEWGRQSQLFQPLSEATLAEWWYRNNHGWLAYDYDGDIWREWEFGQWVETRGVSENALAFISWAIGTPFIVVPDADARRWQSRSTVNAVIDLARHKFARLCEWDADPNVIGLPGGLYLDTDTGEIGRQTWQDYLSRSLPDTIAGDWDTPSTKWANFVDDCLAHYEVADRIAVADYLQMWAGAALTGDAERQSSDAVSLRPAGNGQEHLYGNAAIGFRRLRRKR